MNGRKIAHEGIDDAAALGAILEEGLREDLYTGAAAAIGTGNGVVWKTAIGDTGGGDPAPVTETTRFDAASVTKAVATTSVLLRFLDTGRLSLGAPLAVYLPRFEGTSRGEVPLWRLMTHTAGLEPYYYEDTWNDRTAALEDIFTADLLSSDPGQSFTYSCLNFVHLAAVARAVGGADLGALAERLVFDPIGMSETTIGPLESINNVVATYDHERDDRELVGEIHDPIARVMDGESGNAGLFTTLRDLICFGEAILESGGTDRLFSNATAREMRRDWLAGEHRPHGLGWRLAHECQPAPNWSPTSFGHTGFTGTALWIDPMADRFAILLTNEVYCGKERGFPHLRERFYSQVAACSWD